MSNFFVLSGKKSPIRDMGLMSCGVSPGGAAVSDVGGAAPLAAGTIMVFMFDFLVFTISISITRFDTFVFNFVS